MSSPNEKQLEFINNIDGMIVVDAGPGTGKTFSIVERYVNLIKNKIDPMNVLMLTFTNNAAQEMKERIVETMMNSGVKGEESIKKLVKNIRASTFDSLCLNIVLNSPDEIGGYFGMKESLSRNAHLIENETLNTQYFLNFYSRFITDHGKRYCKDGLNPGAIVSNNPSQLYKLISKLMSRGVIPLNVDWFEKNEKIIVGDVKKVKKILFDNWEKVKTNIQNMDEDKNKYNVNIESDYPIKDEDCDDILDSIADEDREMLFYFIHDVYLEYIKKSISDNRLTFGLVELFAFTILYNDADSRSLHSVDYMMVDEFQDTNELQMKICLLLLKKPNLCVVGDWKQGIYRFRYVSKENITHFEDRADRFITELNKGEKRIPFMMPDVKRIGFTDNYRSSSKILDAAFSALKIPGNKDEIVTNDEIVTLNPIRNDEIGDKTEVATIQSKDEEDEISSVINIIIEYTTNPKYKIIENGNERNVKYNDIAVLSRNGNTCIKILEKCTSEGIPAFFQGELNVMSTREGKLALAWLRYVNNKNDKKGCAAILADIGYSLSSIQKMIGRKLKDEESEKFTMPIKLENQRSKLEKKKRRPNDLLTSIFAFYGLNNEITESIINILSSAYSNSLLTLSDLIRLIEDDIKNKTKYDVNPSLDTEAVTIQTIHKSKGLEYPAVIIAGINKSVFPSTKGENGDIRFDELLGIRAYKEYCCKITNGVKHELVLKSWKSELISEYFPKNYSEERQLFFVALSRAKQYLALTSFKPSNFFKAFEQYILTLTPDLHKVGADSQKLTKPPVIGEYIPRRKSISPHEIARVYDTNFIEESEPGKGTEYGLKVHETAYKMWKHLNYDKTLPETEEITKILDSVKDANTMAEVKCVLPVGDKSIKGIIDLLAIFDDHIEIHDYKTDTTMRNKLPYQLQVSIYAHAAEAQFGKKAKCFIDYVSQKKSVEVEMLSIDEIKEKVEEYFIKLSEGKLTS